MPSVGLPLMLLVPFFALFQIDLPPGLYPPNQGLDPWYLGTILILFAAYGAAKAWVNLWSKALADEGRAYGIRVFAVAPGAVETQMLRGAFPDFPSNETLQPSDVADVIHALAQPACRYVSGQTVFVKK